MDYSKMKKHGFKEKLSYEFDKIMAGGTMAIGGLLLVITLIVILVAGLVTYLVSGSDISFLKAIWMNFNRTLDPGTLGGDEGAFPFMLMLTISTVLGVFITSALIGLINNALESKLTDLRKGKSKVLEEGHVVILGFNDNTFSIISELIIANENQKNACIVVMGSAEKEEMEEKISSLFNDTKTTNIICRSGQIYDLSDLAKCSIETCRSIIINEKDDFEVIKTILAVSNLLKNAKTQNPDAYMVATIHNQRNLEPARIAGEDRAVVLYFKSTIARIIAHACNQPGMSSVFIDLFNFDGDEIYMEDIPTLYGKTMSEIIMSFEKASVIGLIKNNMCMLNPGMDTKCEAGDKVVLIAEDDGVSIPLEKGARAEKTLMLTDRSDSSRQVPEKILFIGYNELLVEIITEIDKYLPIGSEISVAYEAESDRIFEFNPRNVSLNIKNCDIFNQQVLADFAKEGFKQIVILSDSDIDANESDSKTLVMLLHLRNLSQQNGYNFSITSEMRNIRNQELANVARVNDFVISSNITGLMTAQLSQNRQLYAVFEDLLDEDGSEIYFKSVKDYIVLGKPVVLFTAVQALIESNAIFIGYKRFTDEDGNFEIVINPCKSNTITFSENDMFIVISEG